jgi:hypothetical protein
MMRYEFADWDSVCLFALLDVVSEITEAFHGKAHHSISFVTMLYMRRHVQTSLCEQWDPRPSPSH